MDAARRIGELLAPLFAEYDLRPVPAQEAEMAAFVARAVERGVPRAVIDELVQFYRVTNGIPCLDSFAFHRCDDEILFEWWAHRELWLAQRDFYTLRWAKDRWCLGDASTISFSEADEFAGLIDLLRFVSQKWWPR